MAEVACYSSCQRSCRILFIVSRQRWCHRPARIFKLPFSRKRNSACLFRILWEGTLMKLPHLRRFLHLAAGAAALSVASQIANAQTYPSRPITMIVPFAAGGGTDVTARIVSEHMSRTLGQRIIIENIAGAGGTTGSTRAMRASPDGYTIEMGQMGTHATAVALYPNLAYRPEVDFDPIGMVSEMPQMLVARKDFAPKDLKEFIAFTKTNSEKINVGHAGVGSIFFSTCLLLHSILNVKPTLVPFNGGSPAMNALVAGQVDYMCADIVTAAPQLQASTIKGYAIASTSRNLAIPKCAHKQRSWPARVSGDRVVCIVCAEGDAEANPGPAHRRPRPRTR